MGFVPESQPHNLYYMLKIRLKVALLNEIQNILLHKNFPNIKIK